MKNSIAQIILVFSLALSSCSPAQEPDEWDGLPIEATPSLRIEGAAGDEDFAKKPVGAVQGTPIRVRVAKPEGATEIRWFQIVPDTAKYYKNANHPWEKEPYKWVGFGEIDYERVEVEEFRGKWEIAFDYGEIFDGVSRSRNYRSDLGSFWLQAEVLKNGKRLRSAGLAENDHRNLSPSVFRISIRKDDGYLGYLTSFFNVPGLFGSIPYQSGNYIGADCADVLVAANRKWRGLEGSKDYNVAMLTSEWPKAATCRIEDGKPDETLTWGEEIEPGDAIAVRYRPGKQFQHIGALYGDSNENGILDPADFMLHAGPDALHLSKLGAGSFDGEVVILRPPSS
ncbi:MAG: hypothetical protein ACI8UO_004649 [Verrucomicrobiales bacterium]|jgi:hypothetical protein